MNKEVLIDTLWTVALFFLNPLLIAALIAAVLLGYFRVKRERRSFKVRLLPGLAELKAILSESWVHALVLSILISGVGLSVDIGWLVLFCIASLIGLLSFNYKIMSPIYFAAIGFFAIYFIGLFSDDFVYQGWTAGSVDLFGELAVTVPIIAGMLLFTEGLLIRRNEERVASPYLKPTKRGLRAGVFKTKRLWLLPVLFLVPGDMVTAYVPYWPQFTFGEKAFTFIPIPLLIGFSQVARSSFPNDLFPRVGRAVAFIGIVVIGAGVAAIWVPVLGLVALLTGVIGRAVVSIIVSIQERKGGFVLAPSSKGVVIAGVLPDSPGEKMGLIPGECIRAVNGQEVKNEKDLYEAIQINAAHCRLQVVGRDGEVRLMQQVIYRHDHHRLGLLVVR